MKESTKQKLIKAGMYLGALGIVGLTCYAEFKLGEKYGYDKGHEDGVTDAARAAQNFLYDSRVYADASKMTAEGISVNWMHPIIPDDNEREWLNRDIDNDQWRARIVIVEKPKDYDEMAKKNPPESEMEPINLNWTQLVKDQYPQYFEVKSEETEEEPETEEVVG